MEFNLDKIQKANQLMDLGKYQQALEVLDEIPLDSGFQNIIFELRFLCYNEQGKTKKAKQILDIALEKYPNCASFHVHLSVYYFETNHRKKAIDSIKRAIQLSPNNADYKARAAIIFFSNNQRKEGKILLDIAVDKDPASLEVITAQAIYESVLENTAASLVHIDRGLAIDPNNIGLLSLRTKMLTGDATTIKKAKVAAQHALALDPGEEMVRKDLLEVFRNKNKILRFFVGNSFNRYRLEWTFGRVVLMILFWKGVILWGGVFILYLLVTWYGSVLFNSCVRLHPTYKALLNVQDIQQSNLFLGIHGVFISLLLFSQFYPIDEDFYLASSCLFLLILLVGISYFEIKSNSGKVYFYLFSGLTIFLLFYAGFSPVSTGLLGLIFLLIYAFLFTLNIIFK